MGYKETEDVTDTYKGLTYDEVKYAFQVLLDAYK